MQKYLRFVLGLQKYLSTRSSPQEALETAKEILSNRIKEREKNFLTIAEKAIFNYSKSPYLKLLDPKKIKFSDVKNWVESEGIEQTLLRLQNEGVYFTVDEFKGKTEVNRNGVNFLCKESMFDNPFISTVYEVRSGATRSAGTRVRIDFDYLTQRSYYDAFLLHAHDSLTSPIANWFPIFPGAPGINSSLRFTKIGNPPQKWFSQVAKTQVKVNWEKRWGTSLIFYLSKLYGAPISKPQYVNLNNAYQIAKWAHDMLEHHPNCVIYTFATSAVRVCMAAQENNLNIKNVRFLVTGETLTAQKKREIEASGAVAIPVYGISEAGVVAAGCNKIHNAGESDHCHIYKDSVAIIQHNLNVPHFDKNVNAFLFTTLLFESPKLLLNVGMGDYGTLYTKPVDCEYGKIGFDSHIANIRSYEKLTGEGVTFIDTDFIRIIERELPEIFGGQSTDYQLIEEEDEKGLNRLRLLISPKLGEINEDRVVKVFIDLLKKSESSPESWAQSGSVMWDDARTVRVRRSFPIPTRSGKILPFYLVK